MATGTVKLHRVIKATPGKIFRAFTEAEALASWVPPHGFIGVTHEMDAQVGGKYRMSFINFTTLCGTEVEITQEGIPGAIPVEMCYLGWQESLEKLAKLVEPEIPDA